MPIQIVEPYRLSWPAGWPALFGREAPLLLEIGCGNGQFLVEVARQRPEANFLGLDISIPALRRAAGRVRRAGLTNVRLLNCDAIYALWALCRPGELHTVYINFPDPWPKAAHHHRRLINQRFLHLLATRTTAGSLLEVATDHEDYTQVIAEQLQQTPYFESQLPTVSTTAIPQRPQTKYEQIALNAGRSCHYFLWQRNQEAAGDAFPIPQEFSMPHLILRSPLTLEAIQEQFTPASWQREDVSGRFVEIYRSNQGHVLLVDTYIAEEPLSQRVALTIRPRPEEANQWIIGVHELGFPRPTAGVHLAVTALGDWLLSLHPNTQIIERNLVTSSP